MRGHEDDRDRSRALRLPDRRGGFKPVHDGHADVEHDQGKVVALQRAQGLFARARPDDLDRRARQQGIERDEIALDVVDDEDPDGPLTCIPHRQPPP